MKKPSLAFEWDEGKRQANLEKHRVDFEAVDNVDWDAALTVIQLRDGEYRYLTYAPLDNRLYALVWTERGDALRLISFRKANSREADKYEQARKTDT